MLVTTTHTDEKKLLQQVRAAGQNHVLRYWNELDDSSRNKLLAQLREIDFDLLARLYRNLIENPAGAKLSSRLEPADFIQLPKTPEEKQPFEVAKQVGEQALRQGRVAAFVVAGGQGTRLGFTGPKGIFPITPVKQKSFFQLFAEQIKALSRKYQTTIPWLIMTSESNHEGAVEFFERHDFFGLPSADVMLFQQEMIPALDEQGKLILDAKDHIFTNPNGHGGSLSALHKSGALENLRARGIDLLFYFQVDNVLVKICDPVFIGFHLQNRAQMSAKVVSKRDAHEKVGVVAKIGGRLGVVEYSDLSEEQKSQTNPDGSLTFRAGSIAIHVFDVAFIEELNRDGFKLPWHVAHKVIPFLDERGEEQTPSRPNGYKFETFVFDALMYAERTVILEVAREQEFSPVKNDSGPDSPETARRDLVNLYGAWLEQAGVAVPRDAHNNVQGNIEISPLFALDAEELAAKISREIKFDGELYLETNP